MHLNNAAKDLIARNRRKLRSIIDTIILCGRQNIPLCGHQDTALDLVRSASDGHGNVWALLQFCISAGDVILKEHLANAPKNATYNITWHPKPGN